MMHRNPKAKWLRALRSGKHPQAIERLRTPDGFCCLGVACDISGLGEWNEFEFLGEDQYLPLQVQQWLGLENNDGRYAPASGLTFDNDQGVSFREIAQTIRKKFPAFPKNKNFKAAKNV